MTCFHIDRIYRILQILSTAFPENQRGDECHYEPDWEWLEESERDIDERIGVHSLEVLHFLGTKQRMESDPRFREERERKERIEMGGVLPRVNADQAALFDLRSSAFICG